jgi:hypothetical protein
MQDPQGFCAKEEGIAGGWGVSNPLPAQPAFPIAPLVMLHWFALLGEKRKAPVVQGLSE